MVSVDFDEESVVVSGILFLKRGFLLLVARLTRRLAFLLGNGIFVFDYGNKLELFICLFLK